MWLHRYSSYRICALNALGELHCWIDRLKHFLSRAYDPALVMIGKGDG
jgi:hypothetical protein